MRGQLVLDRGNNTKWTFSTTPYLEGLEGISEATRSTITNHVHTHTLPHINTHRHTLMHIHFHIQKNKEHCVSLTKLFPRGDFLCLYRQCLTQYTHVHTPCVSQCQQHEDAIITSSTTAVKQCMYHHWQFHRKRQRCVWWHALWWSVSSVHRLVSFTMKLFADCPTEALDPHTWTMICFYAPEWCYSVNK